MQKKHVLILLLVTAAAVAVSTLARLEPDAAAATGAAGPLFPELGARINDVTEVRVEKGGKSATLKREGGKWKLADRGGYPAKFENVKELAVRIADLQIEEAKTAKKANHAKLGVEWPVPAKAGAEGALGAEGAEDAGSESGLVTLRDASGKDLAALVVGNSEWRGSKPKVYARRLNEDQVYLCEPRGTLSVLPDAKSWIEPKFVELQNDRVQTVTIEHADGEKVEIGRSAANHTQFTLQNLLPGQDERYEGVANGVAQALGYGLQLEDVRPVTEVDFTKEPLAKARFRCVDGLELVVETAKFEDKTWVKVQALYTPPPEPPQAEPAPVGEAAATPLGEGEEAVEDEMAEMMAEVKPADDAPAEEQAAEKKDIAKEAAELNERLAPWAFEVATYKSDVLARRMKDLLAEPAPEGGEAEGLGDALEQLGLDQDEAMPGSEPEHDHEHEAEEEEPKEEE